MVRDKRSITTPTQATTFASAPEAAAGAEPYLIAYRLTPAPPPIVPAPRTRDWMDASKDRFAYRCLPLLMANQHGWFVLSTQALTATWDGGMARRSVHIDVEAGPRPSLAVSNFGHGIVTFLIPYLFRTPPGWNLLARGPANLPTPGAFALEGLVETDWALAPFTMNWQLTDPGRPVRWEIGEPICMIVPQRRDDLPTVQPVIRAIDTDPALRDAYLTWEASRRQFRRDQLQPGTLAYQQRWQRHYFQGTTPDGQTAPEHQTKLALRQFAEEEDGWCLE